VVRIDGTKRVHSELQYFHIRDVNFEILGRACSGPLGILCHDTTLPKNLIVAQTSNRMVLLTLAGAIPTEPSKVTTFNPVRSYVISLGAQANNPFRLSIHFPFLLATLHKAICLRTYH
jgi:hypothetical protein